ncbi:MAG: hypothetical protein KJ964_07445 [Verrucomicrobia bacterium]|nr:hypothetical protein [Verrucomicrobiota bacterium]MBU1735490.1 hypothetical protein [Verrucomicrobiota bacterium]MBU1856885.1 hypothetical protein [Verrucomicrobiota bacterium]
MQSACFFIFGRPIYWYGFIIVAALLACKCETLLVAASPSLNNPAADTGGERNAPMEESHYRFTGWDGGIGIAFGSPATTIPDVLELGYDIVWGAEIFARESAAMGTSMFRYWNSIIEISLKGPADAYDFSGMQDKQKAAELAFDAWAEIQYGAKGLSKYAKVQYKPDGTYGDVYGRMDLSSENPLVDAVINRYMKNFDDQGITKGGVGLDNTGVMPEFFLKRLREQCLKRGLGIAANGCPDKCLKYIDFFCNEGFPFTVRFARDTMAKGFNGIFGEFTMQHLSPGEFKLYLKTRLFNRIVFFGYTNGGVAKGATYSFYFRRPDVYHHQRWVARKYIPLSRALCRMGRVKEKEVGATLVGAGAHPAPAGGNAASTVKVDADGKVFEYKWSKRVDVQEMVVSSTGGRFIDQYGKNAKNGGVYLFVNSTKPEEVECNAGALGINASVVVFDEFNERLLDCRLADGKLAFRTTEGPALVQIADRKTIAANILARVRVMLEHQLLQRKFDRETAGKSNLAAPIREWPVFCREYVLDGNVKRSGNWSMKTEGGTYKASRWNHYQRRGAGQLIDVNQSAPEPLVLTAYCKADAIPRSDKVDLNNLDERMKHFDVREAYTCCVRLYLDYQDGEWPEVHSGYFTPGTHDWDKVEVRVTPKKPVKTAMVLVEFHQPEGVAWFDDITLTPESQPGRNLLAYGGFEKDEVSVKEKQRIGDEYEALVKKAMDTAASMIVSRKKLAELKETIGPHRRIDRRREDGALFRLRTPRLRRREGETGEMRRHTAMIRPRF